MNIDLRLGDCIEVLKTILDNSIDSIVTDPPYHLTSIVKRFGKEDSAPAQFGTDGAYARASKGFMGKEWDGGDIAFRPDVWKECYRVLKPGGHLLAFSHSRTYHRMAVAVEDAGFEIRDQIMWIYGSGFPKSLNIGKAVDKKEGNDREVIYDEIRAKKLKNQTEEYDSPNGWQTSKRNPNLTKGNSEWEGWGTALKPAHEPIVMARKPLSEKSIAENVLKHGTGGINIDGSRIEFIDSPDLEAKQNQNVPTKIYINGPGLVQSGHSQLMYKSEGRFPANIIFDEEAGKLLDEQSGISKSRSGKRPPNENIYGGNSLLKSKTTSGDVVRGVDDSGGASRFFYCPKTSKKDRNEGLLVEKEKNKRPIGVAFNNEDDLFKQTTGNNHPTVKPTDLMRYLINLVTPQGGTTLDPFMGSGSTGKAAIRCGVNFIGIEKEQEYMEIAKARINHERNKPIQGELY